MANSDLSRLVRDLHLAPERVGVLVAGAIRKTALQIEADAKQVVPVDTGNLRSSISTSFTGDGRTAAMEAEVGPTAEYGAYVEYGTSRMSPQPYMGPAADRNLPLFDAAIEAAISLGTLP